MSKLLAVDLDGTLFYPKQRKKCISKKNIAFLRKWIDLGNKVVLVSSRSYNFTQRLLEEIDRPVDFINCIGGQIRVNNEIIKDSYIPNDIIVNALKKIDQTCHPLAFSVCTDEHPFILKNNSGIGKLLMAVYKIWYFLQGPYRENFILNDNLFDTQISKNKVYIVRVMFGLGKNKKMMSKEINKVLRQELSEIECSWTDIIIEITPKGCTKAGGIKYYVKHTGFDKDDVYVVGDSGNDITMFQDYFENSYCMKHAYPSVKKYAKHIISRVHKLDSLVLKGEN